MELSTFKLNAPHQQDFVYQCHQKCSKLLFKDNIKSQSHSLWLVWFDEVLSRPEGCLWSFLSESSVGSLWHNSQLLVSIGLSFFFPFFAPKIPRKLLNDSKFHGNPDCIWSSWYLLKSCINTKWKLIFASPVKEKHDFHKMEWWKIWTRLFFQDNGKESISNIFLYCFPSAKDAFNFDSQK